MAIHTPLTILGIEFSFVQRYAKGHVCNEAEARVLNSSLGEALHNNFARRVKAAQEANQAGLQPSHIAKLKEDFLKYESAYFIGMGYQDPIVALSRKLAKEAISVQLRKGGVDPKSKDEAWFDTKIEAALAAKPYFRQEATRRIESTREVASQVIDGLDL
jgi:hypothetical protein